ncbi:MAG TPA: hypothetical protein VEF34_19560 [Syntrophobacteraceae bacterium]|nr:hypothetical protein [Syntrophobacteraceae bacterium]
MKSDSPHLQIIGQLAREYDEKYRDLEKLISKTQPQNVPPQLRALAENAVDHFRSAQVAILSMPALFEGSERRTALHAMVALCRAFDEMHILFNFLFDSTKGTSTGCRGA